MPRGLHCNKQTYMYICVYTAHVFSVKEVTGSVGGKLAGQSRALGRRVVQTVGAFPGPLVTK